MARGVRSAARITRSCHTANAANADAGIANDHRGDAELKDHQPDNGNRADGGEPRIGEARIEAGEARMFRPRAPPVVVGIRLVVGSSNRSRSGLRCYLNV